MGKKGGGGPGDRKSQTAKAGKRHGTVTYPANLSAERRAAKEQGEQQFVAKQTQSVPVTKTVIVHDKKTNSYVYKDVTTKINTEHTWDAARGRVIVSPRFKEAK